MKYYVIERKNHSGGSSLVAWDVNAKPFYCSNRSLSLKFVEIEDAETYMSYCSRTMPTEKGQTEWKVVMMDTEK